MAVKAEETQRLQVFDPREGGAYHRPQSQAGSADSSASVINGLRPSTCPIPFPAAVLWSNVIPSVQNTLRGDERNPVAGPSR